MSEPPTLWKSQIDVIIPHPEAPQVLLLASEAGWQLPTVLIEHDDSFELCQVTQALERRLGISTVVLLPLAEQSDEQQQQEHLTYLLENRSPPHTPEGGRWAGRAALSELTLADPGQRALIEAWLDEQERATVPATRAPWASPGWFDTASAWIVRQLALRGMPLTGPIEQVQSWCLSCVLRARAGDDTLYFKAAAQLPLFAPEPAIMDLLARWYPDQVPAPLCMDAQRGWMLLRDLGPPVGHDAALAARERLIQEFGALQHASVTRIDDLLAIGCLDRRLEHLPGQLDALLRDTSALSGLEDAEISHFQTLQPRLAGMCLRLADYPIPQTIVHGDLHLGNVAINAGQYQFFDWTDVCISHPFFDMLTIYSEPDPAVQAHLRDIYLATWASYAPMETLLEAWALAAPLCDLHQAISYQYILGGVEQLARSHFAGVIPRLVRRIVQALAPDSAEG